MLYGDYVGAALVFQSAALFVFIIYDKIINMKRIIEKQLSRDTAKKKSPKIPKRIIQPWNLATRLDGKKMKNRGSKSGRKSSKK